MSTWDCGVALCLTSGPLLLPSPGLLRRSSIRGSLLLACVPLRRLPLRLWALGGLCAVPCFRWRLGCLLGDCSVTLQSRASTPSDVCRSACLAQICYNTIAAEGLEQMLIHSCKANHTARQTNVTFERIVLCYQHCMPIRSVILVLYFRHRKRARTELAIGHVSYDII